MKHIFRMAFCLLLMELFVPGYSFAQNKPAYVLFDGKGHKLSYRKMLRKLAKADVILFGEYHNNPIAHWLELSLTTDLHPLRPLMLGAEMFERDNQQPLNAYLLGQIDEQGLDSQARLWPNFNTDYKPLVDFAKANHLPFIATNVPRRYASLVAHSGFESLDTLPAAEKAWIAPLPIAYDPELPCYRNMLTMMPGHGGPNLPKAQALKDATMAWSILQAYRPGTLFFHFNGSYHSDQHEGILWYLKKENPALKYLTISVVSQENLKSLEKGNLSRADFIICVDAKMTNTY